MARLRNPSLEPDRRVRKVSQPPETAPRMAPAPARTRNKSASPGRSTIARRTAFRRGQPTPVRSQQIATTIASPPQQQLAKKVVKRTGRTGNRRAESVESDGRRSSAGSDNGGVLIAEPARQALAFVPEDEEVSSTTPSKYQSARLAVPHNRHSPSLSSIFSNKSDMSPRSTPGPDATGTQLELEDMDMDLMLETFPDLDTHAQKLLDLLILHPPTKHLQRDLSLPGSKPSKRLRLYEQNFNASKSAYGTSQYLNTHIVGQALGGRKFNPLLHKANLAVLANFAYTAQESSDSTFQELKEVERLFPAQFGDVVNEKNFQVALDLRTQTLILGMARGQERSEFDPDVFLQYFFFEVTDKDAGDTTQEFIMNHRPKPWTGMKHVEGWVKQVLTRIEQIHDTFGKRPNEEIVDFEELSRLFPWNGLVNRIKEYVQTRLAEIEKDGNGASIKDLVNAAKDVTDMAALESRSPGRLAAAGKSEGVTKDQSEVAESVQESDQESTKTPKVDVEQPSKPKPKPTPTPKKKASIEYPLLPAVAESVEVVQKEVASVDDVQSLRIAPFKQLKKKLQQQEREVLESPAIVSNTAQMRELKRRKTEPPLEKKVEVPPRVTTSLGAQDSIATNKAQVKLLKSLRSGAGPSRLKPQEQEQNDEESNAAQKPPPSSALLLKEHYHMLEKNKNKENDKGLALVSPVRGMKRKRFLDHQEGATRVSQIDDNTRGDISPPKRRQVEKGKGRALPAVEHDDGAVQVSHSNRGPQPVDKGKGRALPAVKDNEVEAQARASQSSRVPRPMEKRNGRALPPVDDDETEGTQARTSHGNRVEKGKGRASSPAPAEREKEDGGGPKFGTDDDDEAEEEEEEEEVEEEDDDEDEEDDDYEPDARAENHERLKKSRRNLNSTGTTSTVRSRTSARTSGSPARSGTSKSPVRRSSKQSNAAKWQVVPHRGSRQRTPIDIDTSDDEERRRKTDLQVARVNRLAKDLAKDRYARSSAPAAPKRQIRATWGVEESDLLIKMIGEVGCRWATIRDMREPLFRGRTDVQLKDKARNIKFDYLKTRVPLPLNFDIVTISRKQIEALQEMGIDVDANEN